MNEGTHRHNRFLRNQGFRSDASSILEAVPWDRWVDAFEIAEAVGFTPHKVGGIIGSQLKGVYVERRQKSPYERHYLYRRLSRVALKSQEAGFDGSP